MRKKLTNKDKFMFKEEEVLPPAPVPSRISAQSRLTRKADSRPAFNPTVPVGRPRDSSSGQFVPPPVKKAPAPTPVANHKASKYPTPCPGSDPVLDAVVAKLKTGLYLSVQDKEGNNVPIATAGLGSPSCVCSRPLKLIMCGECGMTFPARLKMPCPFHPHDIYLLDIEQCKGCNQNNRKALVEYDLPEGMETGVKNTRVR